MPTPDNTVPPVITSPGSTRFTGGGTFVAGSQAAFFFYFVDISGNLYDPSNMSISITNSADEEVESGDALDKVETGTFAYTWTIPSDTPTGQYTVTLTYLVETVSGTQTETLSEKFVIVERGPGGTVTLRQIASRAYLESLISYAQRIPVWNETVRFTDSTKSTGELSYPRWNQTAGAKVYVNGQRQTSGYVINYFKGWITFTKHLSPYDDVTVDYNFRWFTDDELDNFVEQGINTFNMWPPHSVFNINNIPDRWVIVGIRAAAIDALRRWMFDLNFQPTVKIFGGFERAQQVFQNMDTIKKNYEGQLDKMLEQKKYGPYAGLTKTITVPEFTLPGGRCLAANSEITYLAGNMVNSATIEQLFSMFQSGISIQVLSDRNGELYFADVSKIWESGKKQVLCIRDDRNNAIEVSNEHIMFVNDKETPAENVVVGDRLTVIDNGVMSTSTVTSVGHLGSMSKEVQTFDIEVPETENLFANNIKCHNSRWFRYLFKGS